MIAFAPNPTSGYMRRLHERLIVVDARAHEAEEILSAIVSERAALRAEIDHHQPPMTPDRILGGVVESLLVPSGAA